MPSVTATASAPHRRRRNPRGYLLLESVVCGAIAAVILAATLSQLSRARLQNVAAARDVISTQFVLERLDQLRNTPYASLPAAGVGVADGTPLNGYTRKRTIATGSETLAFPAPAGSVVANFTDITIEVTFRTSSAGGSGGLVTRKSQATTRVYQ